MKFIALPTVCDLVGVSKTSIYSIPDFPKPIKIKGEAASRKQGGARWVEAEILAWMQARVELRDGVAK